MIWEATEVLLAHGIGSAEDLPLPLPYAAGGAAVALALTFGLAAVLWRRPVLDEHSGGWELPGLSAFVRSLPFRAIVRTLGFAVFLWVVVAAVAGADRTANPTFGVVYVLLWTGLLPASVLLGAFWRSVNPVRTLHLAITSALRLDRSRGIAELPAGLGYWPAAAGLLAFAWLELVAPGREGLETVRLWFGCYLAVHLIAALVYGPSWLDRGDAFEVASKAWARLSPWRWRRTRDARDGERTVLVLGNPLRTAAAGAGTSGMTAVVAVLLGSTAYDSITASPFWASFAESVPLPAGLTGTLSLVLVVAAVAGAYVAAVAGARRLARSRRATVELAEEFSPTLIPIAAGYMVAHYFTLLMIEGQRTLFHLSDPLVNGSDLLGLTGNRVSAGWIDATAVAGTQVGAIILGHVLGVLLAHERALRVFGPERAGRSQLPLVALMLAYTVGGLLLLFAE